MRSHIILALLCLFAIPAHAQYLVNWPTQPPTPLATDMETGSQTLKISGVNDILYSYDVNIVEQETTTSVSAYSVPAPDRFVGGKPCQAEDVKTFLTLTASVSELYNKNMLPASATAIKTLQQSLADWNSKVDSEYRMLPGAADAAERVVGELNTANDPTKTDCDSRVRSAKPTYEKLTAVSAKVHGTHTVETTFQAKGCKSEILTIQEKYEGQLTGQQVTARLDAVCDEFTVGGGVLLTEIQNRNYTSTPLPNQAGQFLSVGGTGKFTPTLLFLTSFNFPFATPKSGSLGDMRFGISTGPVLQVGATNASSFGWFIGGTISFFHRLYITPGEHFGQFADYPAGFTGQGAQIPAGFGQLTPVTRWTGRFAIAITIKGWDASKTLKGGQDVPQPAAKK